MPITVGAANLRRLDDEEYGAVVFETMRTIFAVHDEFGRFFEEKIYHREILRRIAGAQVEVPITVTIGDFSKTYYIDLIVGGGAIFELKTAEMLFLHDGTAANDGNSLFLADLPHGKLVTFRPERVSHEFVNNVLSRQDRTEFEIIDENWTECEAVDLKERMLTALHDWGTALDLALYEDAASHFCGRSAEPLTEIEILSHDCRLGTQKVRLADDFTAIKVTALSDDAIADFECHARRFLAHTTLRAIQWFNVTRAAVQFKTLMK